MSTRKKVEFDHVAYRNELERKRSEVVGLYDALDPFNGIQERRSPMYFCDRMRLVFRENVSFNPEWLVEILRLVEGTGVKLRGVKTSYADDGGDSDNWADGRSSARIDLDFHLGVAPYEGSNAEEAAEYDCEVKKLMKLYDRLHEGPSATSSKPRIRRVK